MMTITLDDGKSVIEVPQSWDEIRLEDYEEWFDTEPKTRKDEIMLVAQICKTDPALLLENPTKLFDTIADCLHFVFEPHSYEATNKIKIDGMEYCIAFTDELTLAEWIDIELVFESDEKKKLSSILSILCRPFAETYDTKRCEERAALFSSLGMDKILPLLAFFLHRNNELKTISNLYSQIKEQTEEYLQHIQDFAENGDGIKSLPTWQKIKFFCLKRFLKNRLSKFSDSFFTA